MIEGSRVRMRAWRAGCTNRAAKQQLFPASAVLFVENEHTSSANANFRLSSTFMRAIRTWFFRLRPLAGNDTAGGEDIAPGGVSSAHNEHFSDAAHQVVKAGGWPPEPSQPIELS